MACATRRLALRAGQPGGIVPAAMAQPTTVITGATGFLGRELVLWLLANEADGHLTLLVRGRDEAEAQARGLSVLTAHLRGWGRLCRTLIAGRVYTPYLSLDMAFDTRAPRAGLAGSGIEVPRVEDYFANLFRFAIETDWGKKLAGGGE